MVQLVRNAIYFELCHAVSRLEGSVNGMLETLGFVVNKKSHLYLT